MISMNSSLYAERKQREINVMGSIAVGLHGVLWTGPNTCLFIALSAITVHVLRRVAINP
jgi:hypothetical protein